MFKCKWANTTRNRRKDSLGFDLVNFSRLIHTGENEDDEPYIRASDAKMVYYVQDESDKDWFVPVHLKPRDLFEMGDDEVMESVQFPLQNLDVLILDDGENIPLARANEDDVEPIVLPNNGAVVVVD